ncbi:AAA family ATPase [Crossiella sp. SN42]|uniref:AAA family ATPase n=1 Tax=Crossiella sp. SN42 TaxID=2944808 RepID=UPI0035AC0843
MRQILVEGFTSIRSASVELGQLNVLVGANGAGKSNFIRAFEMLGRIADEELGYFVGKNGGAAVLLNEGAESDQIHLRLTASSITYEAVLEPAGEDYLVLSRETLSNKGSVVALGHGGRETGMYRDVRHREISAHVDVVELLRGCRVFHFHDAGVSAPPKRMTSTADNLMLRQDAGNLAAVLLALRDDHHTGYAAAYDQIVNAIRLVAPFFRDFVLEPNQEERVLLRWRQQGSDQVFSAGQMSDGTLRFVCLATLLLHPRLPALVVLDEPELGLHPFAIVQLADLLRAASTRSQVLIATQSVTLMNQFTVDDLIVVERAEGASRFHRPDPEALRIWLDEYSLGEIWEMNLIGGRPTNEGSARG